MEVQCAQCLAQPDSVTVSLIRREVALLIITQCVLLLLLHVTNHGFCFLLLQVIETLSKLSHTPIALGTGIRYVTALVNGGSNASAVMLLGKVVRCSRELLWLQIKLPSGQLTQALVL